MKRPVTFSAEIGGYFGPSYSVALRGKRIRYRASRDGRPLVDELLEPSTADWAAFSASVEAAGIWSWASSYCDPGTLDGTSWSVSLEIEGRRMTSSGSNAFPRTFDEVSAAISRLVGGRDFA